MRPWQRDDANRSMEGIRLGQWLYTCVDISTQSLEQDGSRYYPATPYRKTNEAIAAQKYPWEF